ncbi:transglutaminase domain-containing protein [Salana multivorans]
MPGSSLPTDGAERTLLARQGVCRDYAHLVVALLRALDVPGSRRRRLRAGDRADGLPRGCRGLRQR